MSKRHRKKQQFEEDVGKKEKRQTFFADEKLEKDYNSFFEYTQDSDSKKSDFTPDDATSRQFGARSDEFLGEKPKQAQEPTENLKHQQKKKRASQFREGNSIFTEEKPGAADKKSGFGSDTKQQKSYFKEEIDPNKNRFNETKKVDLSEGNSQKDIIKRKRATKAYAEKSAQGASTGASAKGSVYGSNQSAKSGGSTTKSRTSSTKRDLTLGAAAVATASRTFSAATKTFKSITADERTSENGYTGIDAVEGSKSAFSKGASFATDAKKASVAKSYKKAQKSAYKQQYSKALRGEKSSKAAKSATKKAKKRKKPITFEAKVKKIAVAFVALALIYNLIIVTIPLLLSLIGGFQAIGFVIKGTYQSEVSVIEEAELIFREKEANLALKINSIPEDYPDYDYYTFKVGEIGHDPYVLINYLSAVYGDFSLTTAKSEIATLFSRMYQLSYDVETAIEIREETVTVTVPVTHTFTVPKHTTEIVEVVTIEIEEVEHTVVTGVFYKANGEMVETTYTYVTYEEVEVITYEEVDVVVYVEYEYTTYEEVEEIVEVEYEVQTLVVTLTVTPLETLVANALADDEDAAAMYELYFTTYGFIQNYYSPLNMDWYDLVTSYYGYRVGTYSGEKEFHYGVDIAVDAGTPIYAVLDGTVTATGSDTYDGKFIIISDGTTVVKYTHLSAFNVTTGDTVTHGTQLGLTGRTGRCSYAYLHIQLYTTDSEITYLNPIFYLETGSI